MRLISLKGLQRQAGAAARWRGHRLRWSTIHGESRTIRVGVCRYCEAQVSIRTRVLPNEIAIGGEAVALNCPGKMAIRAAFDAAHYDAARNRAPITPSAVRAAKVRG